MESVLTHVSWELVPEGAAPRARFWGEATQKRKSTIESRNTFLDLQKELRGQLKESSGEQRVKVRAELQAKRQEFLAQQKEARADMRAELKAILTSHHDALAETKAEAKADAKANIRARKGGDE